MARARSMTSGLRNSGTKGPKTGTLRAARNSSAAFFCSGVILSGGMGGMRSAGVVWGGLLSCISSAPGTAATQALPSPALITSRLDTDMYPPRFANSAQYTPGCARRADFQECNAANLQVTLEHPIG